MRHGKSFNHLSRTASHRKAMLSNMAASLVLNKRISTTVAKAKALRKYVEPLLTKAKVNSTHSRRLVFAHLREKQPIKELFDEVAQKIADRPGGYTRIVRTGRRNGDNAQTCLIELVDYNEVYQKKGTASDTSKPRRRRGRKKGTVSASPKPAAGAAPEETPDPKVSEPRQTDKDSGENTSE